MLKKLKKFLVENKVFAVIILAALALRLLFLSSWLEDWDSVQFALGIHDFDILKHQPHPPGYPLFILMGKFLYLFTGNDTISLTLISGILGALTTIPLYLLVKKMFNQRVALWSTTFFIFLPVHWVLSEVSISNIPGLFFLILLLYLSYRDLSEKNPQTVLGLVAALSLGVRATDAPIVLAILVFAAFKRRNTKYLFFVVSGLLLGILLWLTPVILKTGFSEFRAANAQTASYVIWHDALFGKPFSLPIYLADRAESLMELLKNSYTTPFLVLFIASFFISLSKRNLFNKNSYQLLAVYFFSYLIPLVFLYNLELAQYTLPLIFPLVIFVSILLTSLKNSFLKGFLPVLLSCYLLLSSFPQVYYQKRAIPPTIAAVHYVKENLKPEETLLITTFTFRQFQYYAPEFQNFFGEANAPKTINSKYVVLDYRGLAEELPSLSDYEIIGEESFGPSKNKFVRLKVTNVYILQKKS